MSQHECLARSIIIVRPSADARASLVVFTSWILGSAIAHDTQKSNPCVGSDNDENRRGTDSAASRVGLYPKKKHFIQQYIVVIYCRTHDRMENYGPAPSAPTRSSNVPSPSRPSLIIFLTVHDIVPRSTTARRVDSEVTISRSTVGDHINVLWYMCCLQTITTELAPPHKKKCKAKAVTYCRRCCLRYAVLALFRVLCLAISIRTHLVAGSNLRCKLTFHRGSP